MTTTMMKTKDSLNNAMEKMQGNCRSRTMRGFNKARWIKQMQIHASKLSNKQFYKP